jgi:selenocysteine lyase/cysteine desulfurase
MTFEEARAQFPVLERYAYLNAGTFGPLATSVVEVMTAEQQRGLAEGRMNPSLYEGVFELRTQVRDGFARVLGVPAEKVALTTSTTDACNVVVNGLALAAGDEVVTTDAEHFGLIGALAVSEATVRVARVRDRPAVEALDTILAEVNDRTRLLALSHVNWVNGHAFPWREAKEATGLPVLVDGAQSAGAIPIDASAADFYTASGQKWLCGPDLTGALYVRNPDSLRISLPSYLSQQSYDLVAGTFEPRAGAARFDTHFTPFATKRGLLAAFELHPDWGYDRAAAVAARCRELLAEQLDVVTEPGHSTLVTFRCPKAAEVVKRVFERGVIVRDIPGSDLLRASCGWWTSDEDLERLLAALEGQTTT